MTHTYNNWIPDPIDTRDHLFKITSFIKDQPTQVDLTPRCSAVEDQGALGSCTGNAIVGAIECMKFRGKKVTDLSRLFVYYNERVMENTVHEDSGAIIRDGIKSIADLGVCTEKTWPYKIEKFAVQPSKTAYKTALSKKIKSYERIITLDDMTAALAMGKPFVFGFSVYESFESDIVAGTGMMPMPNPSERLLGGHAVLAVGYDKTKRLFKVRNSWGTTWGDAGYFYMPFDFITNQNYASDFWSITV